VYIDPVITKAAAATMHVDATFAMATYAGMVTAQPLYLAGTGSVPDLVIVVTNQNHAIAFNAASGAKVWDQTLGPPVPQSMLAPLKSAQCGNVTPSIGITGTPVIDGTARAIYLSSMQLNGGAAQHLVYALDADTGMTRSGWPVDLDSKVTAGNLTFSSLPHNQRGALALVGGRVLVPFGGHIGDCGDYRGWVVSISTSDPTQISAFVTRAIAGGIWAPSGISSDGTSIYFTTGNTSGVINDFTIPAMYGDGESVFKLPPDLTRTMATTEYFVPTNWAMLDDADADLGGTGPLLVDLPGSTPSKLVVQFGKDGKAYLIDRDIMGGQSAPPAVATVASGGQAAIITAAATYTTPMGTYAVFRTGGTAGCPSGSGPVRAVKITPGSPPGVAVAWCGGTATRKSPAVTMTNATGADALVWIIGDDNKLRALDGDTGAVVFNGGGAGDTMSAVANFQTPIVVKGRIFAASNAQVYMFQP
jgi:outer membrane protein assembly factor BamB